eukprot:TRINITY_DN3688_c0_g2_i1.p1 TRINITY_DN3688_c0_g2~~TRINITY_DN3688_c0_g2_i1.p1  ORF type:complete len:696 (+),score=206.99 TRINITY_DN3688_c0_g2_i1:30-2090(+)
MAQQQQQSKLQLREKFCYVFDALLHGQAEELQRRDAHVWEEFFLLKVNQAHVRAALASASQQQLATARRHIGTIFRQCCAALRPSEDTLRTEHAIQLLEAMIGSILQNKYVGAGYAVVDLLCGDESAGNAFPKLLTAVTDILMLPEPPSGTTAMPNSANAAVALTDPSALKDAATHLLLTIVLSSDNIYENALVQYFMVVDMFDPISQIVVHAIAATTALARPPPEAAVTLLLRACDAFLLLAVLSNYQRFEGTQNIYVTRLAQLSEASTLEAFSRLCCVILAQEARDAYARVWATNKGSYFSPSGWYKWARGTRPLPPPAAADAAVACAKYAGAALLLLHDLTRSNGHFPPVCARCTPDMVVLLVTCSSYEVASLKQSRAMQQTQQAAHAELHAHMCVMALLSVLRVPPIAQLLHLECAPPVLYTWDVGTNTLNFDFVPPPPTAAATAAAAAANNAAKPKTEEPAVTTLAAHVLTACSRILTSVLALQDLLLYCKVVAVIHSVCDHASRTKQKLRQCDWGAVWCGVLHLLRFLARDEVFTKVASVAAVNQLMNMLNFCITYGDVFLPEQADYDALFYELVRNAHIISGVVKTVKSHGQNDSVLLGCSFSNLRNVVSHYNSLFSVTPNLESMPPQQVMDLIKVNYGSLKLTLVDYSQSGAFYTDVPLDPRIFRQLLNDVVARTYVV